MRDCTRRMAVVCALVCVAACTLTAAWPYLEAREREDRERERQLAAIGFVIETPDSCDVIDNITARSKGFFGQITGTDSLQKEVIRRLRQRASAHQATHLHLHRMGYSTIDSTKAEVWMEVDALRCPEGVSPQPWPLRKDLF